MSDVKADQSHENWFDIVIREPFIDRPFEIIVSLLVTALMAGSVVLAGFWIFLDGPVPPIEIEPIAEQIQVVEAGEYISIPRRFCEVEGNRGTVHLDISEIVHRESEFTNCFDTTIRFIVPDLEPGRYAYEAYIDYQMNPLRAVRVPTQVVRFNIKNEDGDVPYTEVEEIRSSVGNTIIEG